MPVPLRRPDRRIEDQATRFDRKLDEQSTKFDRKLEGQTEEIKRHTGVLLDGVQNKLELLAEGQQAIVERMDRLEVRVESVEKIVTGHSGQLAGLAADLSAHRHDTEAHGRGYLVSEN